MLPSLASLDVAALEDDERQALRLAQRVFVDGEDRDQVAGEVGLTPDQFELAMERLAAAWRRQTGLVEVPTLGEEEYAALRDSIAEYGQLYDILTSHDGKTIVDGRGRLRACRELHLEPSYKRLPDGLSADQLRALALVVNLARRQLTPGAKRGIIRALLLRDPTRSDRSIAIDVGVTHPTVAAARRDLEHAGQLESLSSRRGTDGVERTVPKAKPPREPEPEVVEKEMAVTTVRVPAELLTCEWTPCTAVRLVADRPGFILEVR